MKKLIRILQILLFLILSQIAPAQFDETYFFEHISIEDGLSHIGVKDIFQDSKGFIWIGTYDGLNRYDGLNFRTFHHVPNDSASLINNRINTITETSEGIIWIGTEEGVCNYDPRIEKFGVPDLTDFPYHRINVNKLYEDHQKRLWVLGNRNTIHIIQGNRNSYQRIYYHAENEKETVFYDISPGPEGTFLLASSNGIFSINQALELEPVLINGRSTRFDTRSLIIQDDTIAWFGTSSGLIIAELELHNDRIELKNLKRFFDGKRVNSILRDHESNVWVSMMEDGLNLFSRKNGSFEVQSFKNDPSSSNSLNTNRLRCLYEDMQGILWIGTTESGLTKYKLSSHVFHNLSKLNTGPEGLPTDIVLSFEQIDNEHMLVGTREKGVLLLDIKNNKFVSSDISFDRINDQSVSSILKDSRGIIWIRTWESLYHLLPGRTELTEVRGIEPDMEGICEDAHGNIWLTATTGLRQLVIGAGNEIIDTRDFSVNLEKNDFNLRGKLLYNDPIDSTIWLGTFHNGLINIDVIGATDTVRSRQYYQYRFGHESETSLRSNFITSVIRTSEKDIWIGTEGGGLSHGQFNEGELVFTTYDESHGLSNNTVKAILPDRSGNLWISTNKGLNRFNPDTRQFIVFDYYDGIPSNYFTYASLNISDSLLALGGNKGLTIFNPDYIMDDAVTPIPEFGGFQLFYKTVNPGEIINSRVLLEQSISETDHLVLAHNQNTFSFELLGLHYSNPSTNRLKYMLHGFDNDWIYYNKGHYVANYARIKPGRYQLEFFAANKHGLWSNESKKILITVKPPLWGTVYAYIAYFLILSTIFILLVKNSRRILRLKQKVRIEEIELQKNKELNESKLRFFINVSHEFKTPISLISGPAQYLIKKYGNDIKFSRHLSLIKSQSDYLISLLDQLVYFRKAESDTLELKCQYMDLVQHIQQIVQLYDWQSREQNIELSFVHTEAEAHLWFDKKSMDKVFHNLISNAFKFSKSGGKIDILLHKDSDTDEVVVSVKDRGRGISPENLPHLFKRFFQGTSNLGGYGIGLSLTKSLIELHGGTISVNSIPEKGTEFILVFKTGKDHLKDGQISEKTDEAAFELSKDSLIEKGIEEQSSNGLSKESEDGSHLILIVEDNVKMLAFLKEVLLEDYKVETATNGKEALELMKESFPDLVLCDVMMPVMDGITLCNNIKNNILSCHIPVILLTAKGDADSRINGLDQGADCYLSKPVDIGVLQAEIKSILSNRNKIKDRIRMKLPFDLTGVAMHPLDKSFLERVHTIVEQNFSDPYFDSNVFSKKLFINRSQFYKKMRAITNQTPAEFLREYRMKRAVELIVKDKVPVSEVNEMVGILSRPHFIKCFREIYGSLPSEFLKKRTAG